MPLKFCANLSFMFQDTPSLLARYAVAENAGFKAVECAFPYDIPLQTLVAVKEKSGLEQILINAPPGNWAIGERGLASLSGRNAEFLKSIEKAVEYANGLKCKRVHVMAGIGESDSDESLAQYVENLRVAAKIFEENDLIGLIEPINKYSIPNYFLNNYSKAVSVLKEVDSANLKLQLDLFHLQHINGNLTRSIEKLLPYVGHIQIAQVPNRHEPDSTGEINFDYIFGLLEKHNYDGWIGLEYTPAGNTEEGLSWVSKMGYQLCLC